MISNGKILRNKIVDKIFNIIDKSKFPNNLMGLYLFGFHAFAPLLFYTGIFIGFYYKKYYLIKFILIIWLLILLLWGYFEGCLFTLLEMKLMKSSYTQYDIFYYIFNIQDYSFEEKKKLSVTLNKILILLISFFLLISLYFL